MNLRRGVNLVFKALSILSAGLHKPQETPNARHELARRKRFRDIVVRPEIQTRNTVGFLRPGGQKDDRRLKAGLAQFAANLETAFSRQHHIKENEVKRLLERSAAGL